MSPDAGAGDPEAVRLSTLAARIGAEMDALAALAAALDCQIGAALEESGPLGDPRIGVQDLDRLRQWASDLAMVQRRLADCLPSHVMVPVDPLVARLQLGAVAHRLRTGRCDGTDDGGGVDLF